MKYPLIAIIILATITGCGVTSRQIHDPIQRVGFAYQFENNKLCHQYTGRTAWGNFRTTYELPTSFEELVKETFQREMGRNGIELEFINPGTLSSAGVDFYQRMTWDNSARIVPEHLPRFREVAKEKMFDTVFVIAGDPHTGFTTNCVATMNYRTDLNHLSRIYPPIIYAFSPEGDLAEVIYISVREDAFQAPVDPSTLDEPFLRELMKAVETEIENKLAGYIDSRP